MRPGGDWLRIAVVLALAGTLAVESARTRDNSGRGANREDSQETRGLRDDQHDDPEGDFAQADYIEELEAGEVQMGCTELRSKRYISDGYCTSLKPVTEVVCAGECLPLSDLPWYAEFIKYWGKSKTKDWRCVNDVVRRKRVHLQCENGERRTYRIRAVRSCKCKKYNKKHNESDPGKTLRQSPAMELEEK